MLKHNPSSSTSPNSAIDLTSLLDVVFIVLFVVIIAYSQLVNQKETEQQKQIKELNEKLEEALTQLNCEQFDYDTVVNSYQESVKQYEELNKVVKKITVYCNYNHSEPHIRTLKVITPEKEFEPVTLNPSNSSKEFEKLQNALSEYIIDALGQKNEESKNGYYSDDEGCFVILCLSLKDIQRDDRIKIDEIARTLMENYDNVYYRKFRPDK